MLTFYTVLLEKEGFPVKYIDPATWRVKPFPGPFHDPGEASQAFQAWMACECCYLESNQFAGKARAVARLRREGKVRENRQMESNDPSTKGRDVWTRERTRVK